MAEVKFDCQACGACCLGWVPEYVHVSIYDLTRRLRPAGHDGLVQIIPRGRLWSVREVGLMKMKPVTANGEARFRCVALKGRPGEKVSCGVYESRPTICRQFEPGSNECITARIDLGLQKESTR